MQSNRLIKSSAQQYANGDHEMPKVTYIEPNGNAVEINVPAGWSLMQAATAKGIEGIDAECGGSCVCATCHCYVEAGLEKLPAPSQNELSMIKSAAAERKPNSRLSCQIKVTADLDGLVVRLPETQT
jgi:2Fe-2S ferredoxin